MQADKRFVRQSSSSVDASAEAAGGEFECVKCRGFTTVAMAELTDGRCFICFTRAVKAGNAKPLNRLDYDWTDPHNPVLKPKPETVCGWCGERAELIGVIDNDEVCRLCYDGMLAAALEEQELKPKLELEPIVKKSRLSPLQQEILDELADGRQILRGFHRSFGASQPAVSRSISSLEKRGLVIKTDIAATKYIQLTELGDE